MVLLWDGENQPIFPTGSRVGPVGSMVLNCVPILPERFVVARLGLTEEQKRNHARILNLSRRQMSDEERTQVMVDMRQDGASYRQIAQATGVSKSQVHRELQAVPNGTPELDTVTGSDGKTYPAKQQPKPEPPASLFTPGILILACQDPDSESIIMSHVDISHLTPHSGLGSIRQHRYGLACEPVSAHPSALRNQLTSGCHWLWHWQSAGETLQLVKKFNCRLPVFLRYGNPCDASPRPVGGIFPGTLDDSQEQVHLGPYIRVMGAHSAQGDGCCMHTHMQLPPVVGDILQVAIARGAP